MRVALTAAIFLAGLGYLAVLPLKRPMLRYLLKPGTMLLIIGLGLLGFDPASRTDWLILLGLVCSVAGDIFLMLPRDRFVHGLASFLVAHLFYIAAFTPGLTFGWADAGVIALVCLYAIPLYRRLRPGALERGGQGLVIAVGLYAAVLGAMVWRAVMTGRPDVAFGAVLFLLSDSLLAWNRFVRRLSWADYGVMSTYYAAQFLLAGSIATIS